MSVNTASALKTVCGALYGTSSYNNDFASTLNTPSPPQRYHPSTTQPMPIHRGSLTTDIADTSSIPTRQKWNNTIQSPKNEESCGKRKLCTEADNHLEKNEEDEDEDLDESGEEESGHSDDPEVAVSASNITSTTHGHMISLSHCTNVLPSHMIVTSLSELPSHFRRVTTKYTRYRCPLFPCRVPHYLVRKHQLLPSVITTLPLRMKSGPQLPAMTTDGSLLPAKDLAMRIYRPSVSDSGDTSATSKDRQMSSTTIKDAAVNCHTNFNGYSNIVNDANKGDVDNHLPDLVNDLDAGRLRMDEKGSGAKSHQNGAHYHQHQRHHEHRYHWSVRSKAATRDRVIVRDTTMQECVKRHGHMTQHLGQKFKTEAHTR